LKQLSPFAIVFLVVFATISMIAPNVSANGEEITIQVLNDYWVSGNPGDVEHLGDQYVSYWIDPSPVLSYDWTFDVSVSPIGGPNTATVSLYVSNINDGVSDYLWINLNGWTTTLDITMPGDYVNIIDDTQDTFKFQSYAFDSSHLVVGTNTLRVISDGGQGFAYDDFEVTGITIAYTGWAPIEDLPEETISDNIESADVNDDGRPDYGWTSGYDISFVSQVLRIELNIQLIGDDPGDALRQQWEQGIEDIWSNAHDIVDGPYTYPIEVEVNWVSTNPHHVVTVHSGTGRSTMTHWYTDRPGGWGNEYQDEIAAHEAGHMLGLYDEYPDGALDPDTQFTTTNSLMADLGPTRDWHYEHIVEWLETRSDRDLSSAPSPLPPYPFDDPIPDFSDPLCIYSVDKSFRPSEIRSKRAGAVMPVTYIMNTGDLFIAELLYEDEILNGWTLKDFGHTISVTLFINDIEYEIPYEELYYVAEEDDLYIIGINFAEGVDLYQSDPELGEVYAMTIFAFEPGWILGFKYPMIAPKNLQAGDYDATVLVTVMSPKGITATVSDTATLHVS